MKYLDPKNDIPFKKIFARHKHLLISFLNNVLPLPDDGLIQDIEYLPVELLPDNPFKKDTLVDVRCLDTKGRGFIVEMQMYWDKYFLNRMLHNASKVYSSQLGRGEAGSYDLLEPVYSLGILNDTMNAEDKEFYTRYEIKDEKTGRKINGMEFVLVELPNLNPATIEDAKKRKLFRQLGVLWFRFLKEINEDADKPANDLLAVPDINEAVEICKEGAYTDAERNAYERYWDVVRWQRTQIRSAEEKGKAEGEAKGRAEGAKAKALETARKLKAKGMPAQEIADLVELTAEEVQAL
jgi:predicted transposase/invertase (TIGR01784 family)